MINPFGNAMAVERACGTVMDGWPKNSSWVCLIHVVQSFLGSGGALGVPSIFDPRRSEKRRRPEPFPGDSRSIKSLLGERVWFHPRHWLQNASFF